MKRDIIFHNPRCGKSRQTLGLLNEKNIKLEVMEYLKTPPTKEELNFICTKLNIKPIQIVRTNESIFKELGLSAKDQKPNDEWFNIMRENPILIERPIVIYNQKVALGRPPENVLGILR
jgi:arsenate reductase (glutaredoxin)